MTRPAHLLRLTVLLTVECTMVLVLHRLGRVPALRIDITSLARWLAASQPEDALAAALRLVALALATWLLVSTVAYLLARLSGVPSLVRATAGVTLPTVRRAIERSLAVGALASTLAAPLPAAAQPTAPPPEVEVQTGDGTPLPPGVTPPMPNVEPGPTPGPTLGPAPVPEPTVDATASVGDRDDGLRAGTYRVRAGDHLWAIASRRLAEAAGTGPDDATVARYWRRLVADNRGELRSGDPDLIHPGETITLPPVEG